MTRRKTEDLPALSAKSIAREIAAVDALIEAGFRTQALAHAFAILEAIGRFALAPRLAPPHKPGSVIETLTFDGLLSQGEAQRLRELVPLRNRLIHGGFDVDVSVEDAAFLREVIASVWRNARAPAAAE